MNSRRLAPLSIGLLALAAAAIGCRLAVTEPPEDHPGTTLPPSPDSSPWPSPGHLAPPPTTATSEPPLDSATSGPFRMVQFVDEVLPGTFESLRSTAGGGTWLITDQDIAQLIESTWTPFLAGYPGELAGIDSAGRVWVVNQDATEVSAWDGNTWKTYDAGTGWTPLTDSYDPNVRGGQTDALGRAWFTTSQDVRAFDGHRWTVYTPQDMGMGAPEYEDLEARFQVMVVGSGTVWVSECDWGGPGPFGGRGIRWLEDGVWRGTSSPVASGCATAMAVDSLGRVWAGVERSLWRFDPASGTWQESVPPESPIAGTRFGYVESLVVDQDDSAWATYSLCGGASCDVYRLLLRVRGGVWTQVGNVGGYDFEPWGPVFDSAGIGWLTWDGGVFRIEGETAEFVPPLAGRSGMLDDSGRLWFVARHEGRDALWVLDE